MATGAAGGGAGAIVRGIRPDDLRNRKLIAEHIAAGSLAEFGEDGVALGERLARRLGVGVGDRVTLISPEGTDTAFGTMPRLKTYQVAALVNVGFYESDHIFILSGASIGVVGTLAGFVLGVLFTENIEPIRQFLQGVLGVNLFSAEIYFFTRIPAHLQPGDVAAVVLMALALSFLATLYPS